MYFIEMLPCWGQEVMNYSRTEFLTNQTVDAHCKRRLGRLNKEDSS